MPALGNTQFEILCVLAPVALVVTVIITVITIREIDPALLFVLPDQEPEETKGLQAAISVPSHLIVSNDSY